MARRDMTSNGVEYDYYYTGPDGAHFVLYPRDVHTKEDIDAAKRELRMERDVVSIRVQRGDEEEEA